MSEIQPVEFYGGPLDGHVVPSPFAGCVAELTWCSVAGGERERYVRARIDGRLVFASDKLKFVAEGI